MELRYITPLVLTFNEEANIGRVLDQLRWAQRIVLIDSYSTDRTLEIAAAYRQVDVFQRPFDTFAAQCNYGLDQIDTEWVLSLDADYVCEAALVEEVAALADSPDVNGYSVRFRYSIFGKPLRGSLYPPRTVLYRRECAHYEQDGHAHHVRVEGATGRLTARIHHDDRKPLSAWLDAQRRYARQEAQKLRTLPPNALGLTDRLRKKRFLVPLLTPFYCLFAKGLILDGRAGWYYTSQRTHAELLLSLALLDHDLRRASSTPREEASRTAITKLGTQAKGH